MKPKKVVWIRLSRTCVYIVVAGFGAAGLLLSWQPFRPVVAAAGGHMGVLMQILLDMLEFTCLGI